MKKNLTVSVETILKMLNESSVSVLLDLIRNGAVIGANIRLQLELF